MMSKNIIVWDDNTDNDSITTIINDPLVVVYFDRKDINKLNDIDEAQKPGIYILFGDHNNRYVGQASSSVLSRLKSHDVKKEFWNSALILCREDGRLDKSQLDWIEKRLISKFNDNGFILENISNGNHSHIESYQKGKARQLLNISTDLIKEFLGFDLYALEKIKKNRSTLITNDINQSFLITNDINQSLTIDQYKVEYDDKIIVGSTPRELYSNLINTLAQDDNYFMLLENYADSNNTQLLFRAIGEKEKMVKSRPTHYYRNVRNDIYTKFNCNNNEFIKNIDKLLKICKGNDYKTFLSNNTQEDNTVNNVQPVDNNNQQDNNKKKKKYTLKYDDILVSDKFLRPLYVKLLEYLYNNYYDKVIELALNNKIFFIENEDYLDTKSNPESYKYFGDNIYSLIGLPKRDILKRIEIFNDKGLNITLTEQ